MLQWLMDANARVTRFERVAVFCRNQSGDIPGELNTATIEQHHECSEEMMIPRGHLG